MGDYHLTYNLAKKCTKNVPKTRIMPMLTSKNTIQQTLFLLQQEYVSRTILSCSFYLIFKKNIHELLVTLKTILQENVSS